MGSYDQLVLNALQHIDAYLDSVWRRSSTSECVGPFEVFIEEAPFWPRAARPCAASGFSLESVAALEQALVERVLPIEIEFIDELTPALTDVLEERGWVLQRAPVMVLESISPLGEVSGAFVQFADADDPIVADISAIAVVGFGERGMAVGDAGTIERDAAMLTNDENRLCERIRRGHMVSAAVVVDGQAVCSGSHVCDTATNTTEIVGVATLPAFRRRGFGALLTTALVSDATSRGLATIWLSAEDASVANLYERLGFRRVGTMIIGSKSA